MPALQAYGTGTTGQRSKKTTRVEREMRRETNIPHGTFVATDFIVKYIDIIRTFALPQVYAGYCSSY